MKEGDAKQAPSVHPYDPTHKQNVVLDEIRVCDVGCSIRLVSRPLFLHADAFQSRMASYSV